MQSELTQALVHLDPARFDAMRRPQPASDIVRPHVASETVVRIVGHADDFVLVGPRDRNQHRPEDFFPRHTPAIVSVSEDSRQREISLSQWPVFGRQ